MSSIQSIETPQDYVNYTFNLSARGVTEVTSELAGMSSTVSNLVGLMAFKTSEYLSNTEALLVSFGYAAGATFSTATQQAIRFEQALANVKAIGGETINEVAIGQAAMQFSNRLGMNVDSMTEGLEALSRAGLTATDVMSGVLEEGVKLSKLEGMDLEDSINNLISTTNLLAEGGYDVNSQEYAEAVKAMNQHIVSTSESAPINAQNIIQTLQHVGGYASANKIDQDDLFAVIAQLGSKGTKGEMAGTALRAFIAAGQKDQAQRALQRIGLDVSDLWDSSGDAMLPISEMKQVLDEALEARGYSQQEKLEFYADFAGYKQANQIMKINTDEVQQYKESIAQAWDLGTKLDEILGTVNSNLQIIHQTTKNFLTKVGQTALPILNAILQPIKWTVQLIDALPFSENIVGIGLTFLALKGLFIGINRVVPAIASLYTSFNRQEEHAKNIRGHFENLVQDAQEFKETIEHIKDPVWLANKRMENDKRGMGAVEYGKAVAYSMYGAIGGQDITGKSFDDLSKYEQSTFVELVSSLGQDNEIYQQIVNDIDTRNTKLRDAIINLQAPSQEKITLNIPSESNKKSNLENNNDINNTRGAAKETSDNIEKGNQIAEKHTKILKDAYNTIQGLRQYILAHTEKGTNQYDIGRGIMSIAHPFSEVLVDAFFRRMNLKEFKTQAGTIKFDKDIGVQATTELNKIFDSVRKRASDLPDISFHYDNDVKKMNNKVKSLTKDIQDVAEIFSNTNINNMHWYQGKRALKTFDVKAIGNIGIEYSEMMNEAYIREILKRTDFDKNSNFIKKIYDEQIDLLAESLNVDVSRIQDKAEKLEKIHDKFQSKDNKKTIDDVVATSIQWYHTSLDKRVDPSKSASKWLSNDGAKYIMDTLKINYDNSNKDMRGQFLNNIKGADLETKWVAQQLVFALQKSQTSGVYSGAETYELESMVTHLEALNQSIQRLEDKTNPLLHLPLDENGKFRGWAPDVNLPFSSFKGNFGMPKIDNKEELIYSFLQDMPIVIDDLLPVAGMASEDAVYLNPKHYYHPEYGLDKGYTLEQSFETYIHEMTHKLLQHTVRSDMNNRLGTNNPYSITDIIGNPVQEAEVQSVVTQVMKYLGLESLAEQTENARIQKIHDAQKYGVENEINQQMIQSTAQAIKSNMVPILMRFISITKGENEPMFAPLIFGHNSKVLPFSDSEEALKSIVNNNGYGTSLQNAFLDEGSERQLELKQKQEELEALETRYYELDEVAAAENWTDEDYDSQSALLNESINQLKEEIAKLEKDINGPKPTINPTPEATKEAIKQEKINQQLSTATSPGYLEEFLKNSFSNSDKKEKKIDVIVALLGAINQYTYAIMHDTLHANKVRGNFLTKSETPQYLDVNKIIDDTYNYQFGKRLSPTVSAFYGNDFTQREKMKRRRLKNIRTEQKEKYRQERLANPKFVTLEDVQRRQRKQQEALRKEQESRQIDKQWIKTKKEDGTFTFERNPYYIPKNTRERKSINPTLSQKEYDALYDDNMMYNPTAQNWQEKNFKERRNSFFRQKAEQYGLLSPEGKEPRFKFFPYKFTTAEEEKEAKQYMQNDFVGGYSPSMEQALNSTPNLYDTLFTRKNTKKRNVKTLKDNPISRARFNSDLRALKKSYEEIAKELNDQQDDIYHIQEQQNIVGNMYRKANETLMEIVQGLHLNIDSGGEKLTYVKSDLQQKADAFNNLQKKLKQQRVNQDVFDNTHTFTADTEKDPVLLRFAEDYGTTILNSFNMPNLGQELLNKVNNNIKLTQKEVEAAITLGYSNIITKDALNKVEDYIVLSGLELEAVQKIGYTQIIKRHEINKKIKDIENEIITLNDARTSMLEEEFKILEKNRRMLKEEKTIGVYDKQNAAAIQQADEVFNQTFQVKKSKNKPELVSDTFYERNYPAGLSTDAIALSSAINGALNQNFIENSFKNKTPLSVDAINQADKDYILTRLKQGIPMREMDIAKAQELGLMDENGKFYLKELQILKDNISVQEALKGKEEKTLKLNAERVQIQRRLEEKYSEQETEENPFARQRKIKAQQRKEAAERRINLLQEQYDKDAESRRQQYKEMVSLSPEDKKSTTESLIGQQLLTALKLIAKGNEKGIELLSKIPFEDIGGGELGFKNADADLYIDRDTRQKALDIIAKMQQERIVLPEILRKFVEVSSSYQDIDISKNLVADITDAIKEGFRDANSHMKEVASTIQSQEIKNERDKLSTVQIGEDDYQPVSVLGDDVTRLGVGESTFGVPTEENVWKMRTDKEAQQQETVKEISAHQTLGTPRTGYEDYIPEDDGDYSQFNEKIWTNPKTGENVIFTPVDTETGEYTHGSSEKDPWDDIYNPPDVFNYDSWLQEIQYQHQEVIENASLLFKNLINIFDLQKFYTEENTPIDINDVLLQDHIKQQTDYEIKKAKEREEEEKQKDPVGHASKVAERVRKAQEMQQELLDIDVGAFNTTPQENLRNMQQELLNINVPEFNRPSQGERRAFWEEQDRLEQEGLKEAEERERQREEERQRQRENVERGRKAAQYQQEIGDFGTQTNNWGDSALDAGPALATLFGAVDGDKNSRLQFLKNVEFVGGKLSPEERVEKLGLQGGTFLSNFLRKQASKLPEDAEPIKYSTQFEDTADKIDKMTAPLHRFNDALFRAGEVFPPLTVAAYGLEGALSVVTLVTDGLRLAQQAYAFVAGLLGLAIDEEAASTGVLTAVKYGNIVATWLEVQAEEGDAAAKLIGVGITWLRAQAEMILDAVRLIGLGPILLIIGAIIAVLAVLYVSEQNHANALKESQKALEKSNESMKAATANYKSMRNARINESDATRRHMAALKESIALKKLETERTKRLMETDKNTKLQNDSIWGQYGLRAQLQKSGLFGDLFGKYEGTAEGHEGTSEQIRTIIDDESAFGLFNSSYQNYVDSYYKAHQYDFGRMDQFAPQLQELYGLETQLQKTYGVEGARDSEEFKRAVQNIANETGLSGDVIGQYLDQMQVEANVEYAKTNAQAEFGSIQADATNKAMSLLFPETGNMSDQEALQYNMVMAAVNDEAYKAKRELFMNAIMEYVQAIVAVLTGDWGNIDKHIQAGNTYIGAIGDVTDNQQRIAEESLDVAKENLRKDYGTKSYSYYGDTPFGGAVQAAQAIGLSVPSSGGSNTSNGSTSAISVQNASQTTSQTTQNTKKVLNDTQKQLQHDYNEPINRQQSDNTPTGMGDIMYGIVGKALDFAKHYDPVVGAVSALFGGNSDKPSTNEQVDMNKYEIHINTININTEDDPEKIKTAFMNLMIEMSEQITPGQVSRTIGNTENTTPQGTDININTNNNNPNPM